MCGQVSSMARNAPSQWNTAISLPPTVTVLPSPSFTSPVRHTVLNSAIRRSWLVELESSLPRCHHFTCAGEIRHLHEARSMLEIEQKFAHANFATIQKRL